MPFQFRGDWRSYLELMEHELRRTEVAYPIVQSMPSLANEFGRRASPLTGLVVPAIQSARRNSERSHARVRSMRVLLAIFRYQERTGRLPAGLEELDLPEAVKIDPFTGARLVYRSTLQGPIVYSVGDDLHDDGGVFDQPKDFGFGPVPE